MQGCNLASCILHLKQLSSLTVRVGSNFYSDLISLRLLQHAVGGLCNLGGHKLLWTATILQEEQYQASFEVCCLNASEVLDNLSG
jgi:hypothetical protein